MENTAWAGSAKQAIEVSRSKSASFHLFSFCFILSHQIGKFGFHFRWIAYSFPNKFSEILWKKANKCDSIEVRRIMAVICAHLFFLTFYLNFKMKFWWICFVCRALLAIDALKLHKTEAAAYHAKNSAYCVFIYPLSINTIRTNKFNINGRWAVRSIYF